MISSGLAYTDKIVASAIQAGIDADRKVADAMAEFDATMATAKAAHAKRAAELRAMFGSL
jgi:hypothetical protein